MNKPRKHYEAAFKLEVARMMVDQGLSIAQVLKDMSIGCTRSVRYYLTTISLRGNLRTTAFSGANDIFLKVSLWTKVNFLE